MRPLFRVYMAFARMQGAPAACRVFRRSKYPRCFVYSRKLQAAMQFSRITKVIGLPYGNPFFRGSLEDAFDGHHRPLNHFRGDSERSEWRFYAASYPRKLNFTKLLTSDQARSL